MFLIPHLGTIIWLIIIFSLLWFILSKFAWKPLVKALEERQTSVETALNSADEARKSLAKIEEEQIKLTEDAKNQREHLLREAYIQRDKIIAEAKQKAQDSYELMIGNARKQIEQERKAAMSEIKGQIAVLSVEIAAKLIRSDLGEKGRQERLAQELIKDVAIN
jgi:F-type H+-transporting ATPase subunit b